MVNKQQYLIEATPREIKGKAVQQLRRQGLIPAVVYGHGFASKPLAVRASTFEKIYREAGESTIVQLKVGDEQPVSVLIHDIQKHGTNGGITHVDFYQVKMTEKLTASVPLKFVGVAPAVKELGGTLVHPVSEVEVESLPADLPHEIEVDISSLTTFDDVIRIEDLKVDTNKVKILAEGDQVVALVEAPRSEEELKELESAPEAVDVAAVEGVAEPEKKEEAEDKVEESKEKTAE